MRIRNLPEYALAYKYVVYREVGGECWFYGAYNSVMKAADVAAEVGGKVIETEEVHNEHDIV